jgi:AraC-like DNA-binding protein
MPEPSPITLQPGRGWTCTLVSGCVEQFFAWRAFTRPPMPFTILVVAGRHGYRWTRPDGQVVDARHREVIVVPEGEPHGMENPRPCRHSAVHLILRSAAGVDIARLVELPALVQGTAARRLGAAVRQVVGIWKTPPATVPPLAHEAAIQAAAFALLAELLSLSRPHADEPARRAAAARIAPALERIARVADRRLTQVELARACGLGLARFNALFALATGTTPLALHGQRRMERVCELLAGSDEPIDSIARQCGFFDAYHLSRRFTAAMGERPGAMRVRLRAGGGIPGLRNRPAQAVFTPPTPRR